MTFCLAYSIAKITKLQAVCLFVFTKYSLGPEKVDEIFLSMVDILMIIQQGNHKRIKTLYHLFITPPLMKSSTNQAKMQTSRRSWYLEGNIIKFGQKELEDLKRNIGLTREYSQSLENQGLAESVLRKNIEELLSQKKAKIEEKLLGYGQKFQSYQESLENFPLFLENVTNPKFYLSYSYYLQKSSL